MKSESNSPVWSANEGIGRTLDRSTSKIGQFDDTLLGQQDVAGFDISVEMNKMSNNIQEKSQSEIVSPMNPPKQVQIAQTLQYTITNCRNLVLLERPLMHFNDVGR